MPETVTYSVCNTPTAAQRRRLVDLLQQVRARRLKLSPAKLRPLPLRKLRPLPLARRPTLCNKKASAPDGMGDA